MVGSFAEVVAASRYTQNTEGKPMSDRIEMQELLEHRDKGDVQDWLLSSLMNLATPEIMSDSFQKREKDDKTHWDISLTINGIDISFIELHELWHGRWDHEVKKTVENMLPDAVKKAIERLREKMDEVEEQLQECVYDFQRNNSKATDVSTATLTPKENSDAENDQ